MLLDSGKKPHKLDALKKASRLLAAKNMQRTKNKTKRKKEGVPRETSPLPIG
jgi:hypothetical protein